MPAPLPDNPHVSVLLPIRNGMPHLKTTIEGLLAQTWRNFSLVVQDCLSTDGSLEYLRNLETFFPIHIVSEQDAGLSMGYARAARRATGDLVTCAACDEILDPGALETYVNWYRQHPDAVFIYGGSRLYTGEPGNIRIVQVFQPPVFNLTDYLHIRMCPTQAGAFNRRVIGGEFYFEETLKTCFDFELVSRLALRFGSERLIAKRAITMSARGDRTSATFRPEMHMQIADDKAAIIERLLTGPLRKAYIDFLRRDLRYALHTCSAKFIYETTGDCPSYADHILEADRQIIGRPEIHQLATQSRFLAWNDNQNRPIRETSIPPDPPADPLAQVASSINLEHVMISPEWAKLGARARHLPNGHTEITTTRISGHSAALLFSLNDLDFKNNWYWLRLQYQVTQGATDFVVARFWKNSSGEDQRLIVHQERLLSTIEPQMLYRYIKPGTGTGMILFGNSEVVTTERLKETSQSQIAILSATVIKMPKSESMANPPAVKVS